jgi:hypothetical protein
VKKKKTQKKTAGNETSHTHKSKKKSILWSCLDQPYTHVRIKK